MMLGTVAVAAGFGSSDRLAGAYGTAVSTTMLLTTALLSMPCATSGVGRQWLQSWLAACSVLVDFAFFAANMLKIRDGPWFPLLFGALVFMVMTTWHKGMEAIRRKLADDATRTAAFLAQINQAGNIARVPGTAVFLIRSGTAVPRLLLLHVAQLESMQPLLSL